LLRANIPNRVDSTSGTVGRRYARSDELGIPFGITIDFQTLLDDAVTVRDRDSMSQVRVPLSRLLGLIQSLVQETITWTEVLTKFVIVNVGGGDEEEDGDKKDSKPSSTITTVESTFRGSFSRPIF
jgi:glycyl-tRNA synthetase